MRLFLLLLFTVAAIFFGGSIVFAHQADAVDQVATESTAPQPVAVSSAITAATGRDLVACGGFVCRARCRAEHRRARRHHRREHRRNRPVTECAECVA